MVCCFHCSFTHWLALVPFRHLLAVSISCWHHLKADSQSISGCYKVDEIPMQIHRLLSRITISAGNTSGVRCIWIRIASASLTRFSHLQIGCESTLNHTYTYKLCIHIMSHVWPCFAPSRCFMLVCFFWHVLACHDFTRRLSRTSSLGRWWTHTRWGSGTVWLRIHPDVSRYSNTLTYKYQWRIQGAPVSAPGSVQNWHIICVSRY